MQDVIDRIRSEEQETENMKAAAQKDADMLVSQAKIEGKKHIENTLIEANKQSSEIIRQAEEKAADREKEANASAEKEIAEILEIADRNMESAISKIVEGVVNIV